MLGLLPPYPPGRTFAREITTPFVKSRHGPLGCDGFFIGLRNSFAEKTNTVEIIQDGKIIYTLDLDKNKDELIEVEFQGCKNTIQIKDKQISIIEADCPDKTCVNMGILKSAFTPIVCLPNHLVIQYVNDDKEIDATVN